jgi:hypothetical protein
MLHSIISLLRLILIPLPNDFCYNIVRHSHHHFAFLVLILTSMSLAATMKHHRGRFTLALLPFGVQVQRYHSGAHLATLCTTYLISLLAPVGIFLKVAPFDCRPQNWVSISGHVRVGLAHVLLHH